MDRLSGFDDDRRARVIIAYDIVDDSRRAKVADGLLDHIERVEYSVFDGWVGADELLELWEAARRLLRPAEDAAFALSLCTSCSELAGTIGRGQHPDLPGTSWLV